MAVAELVQKLPSLLEAGGAAAHDFALADELSVEFGAVEGEVDVEVDAVEGSLGRVHALEVFLQVLTREVGCEGDDLLDAWGATLARNRNMISKSLTWVFGILGANVVVAGEQNVFVHQCCAWRDLPEKRHLDRLANLDFLALLHKDLARVFTPVLAVERGNSVLLGMVTLLERLQSGHEVMPAGDAVGDDALCDTGCDGALDNGSDGVHGPDDL